MKDCPHCNRRGDGGIWCPHCKKAYDLEEAREILGSLKWKNFTGAESTSPKVEEFWKTGDPAVFAKPGAPDHKG